MNRHTQLVSRRTALKIASAAGVVGLAGCLGDTGEGDDNADTPTTDSGTTPEETAFPERDIRLVIPYSTGGGYDVYARLVAPHLETHLPNDVNVIPQNVGGAGGQIATEQVYSSDPDGYTMMIVNLDGFAQLQVAEDVEFDLRDMTHFAQIAAAVRGIVIADHTGIETWGDFTEATRNGELRFGTTGPQGDPAMVPAIAGEITGEFSADDVLDNLVIYDGTGEIPTGMLAGDVDVLGGTFSSILPYAESDGISPFVVVTAGDPPDFAPDTPTLVDMGVDVSEVQRIENTVISNRTFAGPPSIPEEIATIIEQAFDDAINDPAFRDAADEADRTITYGDAELARQVAIDKIENWSEFSHLLG